MWANVIAILSFTPTSAIIRMVLVLFSILRYILSSFLRWALFALKSNYLMILKKNYSRKRSAKQWSGPSLLFRLLKTGMISFK